MYPHKDTNVYQNFVYNHQEPEADLKSARQSGAACHSLSPQKGSAPMKNSSSWSGRGTWTARKHNLLEESKASDKHYVGEGGNDVIM